MRPGCRRRAGEQLCQADLAVANYSTNDVTVLLNLGNGTFAPSVAYAGGQEATSITAAAMLDEKLLGLEDYLK